MNDKPPVDKFATILDTHAAHVNSAAQAVSPVANQAGSNPVTAAQPTLDTAAAHAAHLASAKADSLARAHDTVHAVGSDTSRAVAHRFASAQDSIQHYIDSTQAAAMNTVKAAQDAALRQSDSIQKAMVAAQKSAQTTMLVYQLIYLVAAVACLASCWKIFEKMGMKGWEGIVPVYNIYKLVVALGRPEWWTILGCIPVVNFLVWAELAPRFGKGMGFTVGLTLLPFVFLPILAFSDVKYNPEAAQTILV